MTLVPGNNRCLAFPFYKILFKLYFLIELVKLLLKINIFFCSIYFCYFILCCSEKNYFVFYAVFTKLIYAINFFNSCKLIQSNNSQVSRHWKNFSRGELLLISTDTIWKLLTSWVFTQNIAKTFIIRDI